MAPDIVVSYKTLVENAGMPPPHGGSPPLNLSRPIGNLEFPEPHRAVLLREITHRVFNPVYREFNQLNGRGRSPRATLRILDGPDGVFAGERRGTPARNCSSRNSPCNCFRRS